MHVRGKILLLTGIWFACTQLASAQEDTTALELNNVTITENRMQTPFSESARSIYVVTRQDIKNSPAQSLAEVLSNVPGVDIRQRGPAGVQADVSIRGGTFEQTLILVNGVKLSDPQTGHHLMNLPLDMDNVERIEVIKGPGARIYGQNAFSGAINIITKVPEQKQIIAGAYGGDFTTFGGNIGLALPGKNYGQYISAAHDQSEGYRSNTDYNISNLFYQSYLKTGSGQLNLIGGYTSRAFGAAGFYYQPNSEEYEEVRTGFVSLDYEQVSNNWRLQPRVYWRRNYDDYILIRSNPEVYHNIHTTHVAGAEFNATYHSQFGLTGLGIEARREFINSTNLGDWRRTTAGIFAEHRFYFFDKLDVTPGLYLNWYSDYGWNLFPGVDASYDITSSLKVFANTGRSFRIPTYTDLYYQGPTNVGNDQLQPERAWTYEGGFKYFTKNFWGQLSYFKRDASQLIDWVRDNSEEPWQPQNFYDVDIQGFEVGGHFTFADHWLQQLSLNYNYLHTTLKVSENVESRYALDNLKHQLIFSATHKIYGNIQHTFSTRYLDRVSLSDYLIMDSRLSYQNNTLNVYAEVTNLTDTDYIERGYTPMPGRWLRAGVDVKIGL